MGKELSKRIKKQLINIVFLVVLVGVTILVLFLSNKELNFENIREFLSNCNPWWLVAAAVAMVFSVVFEALSVHFILRGLGERPKLRSSLVYATADVYYSAITPSATGGQPASAYYMVKDGIGAGKSSFTLVFNIIFYTAAIIIIAATAFIIRPEYFRLIDNWFAHVLIIAGFVLQGVLLLFFIGCMFWGKFVLKCGSGIITLLTKLRIVKKPEKWREKLGREVEKYGSCLHALKIHPFMSVLTLLFNLGQRLSAVLISCFVCLAAAPGANIFDLFALQALVLIGYNSIPLPGGVGAFEFLYLCIYAINFDSAFILVAVMVTRLFSYYLRMILSGIYTLVYHIRLMRRKPIITEEGETQDGREQEQLGEETEL